MGKKGQIEVVALFGVIFLVVVVVFYAYQSNTFGTTPVPAGVAEQQKTVKETISNFIHLGAKEILANMSRYGGYINAESFSSDLRFNKDPVPYWQKAGMLRFPTDIYNTFMTAMNNYVKDNIEFIMEEMDMENVTVETSTITVSGNILSDHITLNVYLPVYVHGYLVPQPLTVTIPTRFGEIIEFSQGLMTYSVHNRPFEWFTLSSMLMSEPKDGAPSIPFFLAIFDCGKIVMRNWFDVQPAADYAVKVTLAHTYMPGKAPQGTYETAGYPKYSLPTINGKEYSNLDVSFHVPDDFELSRFRFNFKPDPIMVIPTPVPMTDICRSDPVYVKYYMKYPMIVRIRDPDTGNVFQFGNEVYINNNGPGSWGTEGYGYSGEEQAELCSSLYCDANIAVKDSSGNPVPHAHVSFMGCDVGQTLSDGTLSTNIPCGAGLLEVYKNGYKEYRESISYHLLDNYDIQLRKKPQITVHVYKVNVRYDGSYLTVYDREVTEMEDMIAELVFASKSGELCEGNEPYCYRQYSSGTGDLRNVASDSYAVSGRLTDSEGKTWGVRVDGFTITDSMEGGELYIYLPYNQDYETAIETGDSNAIESLGAAIEDLLETQCGIDLISETGPDSWPDTKLPCSISYGGQA